MHKIWGMAETKETNETRGELSKCLVKNQEA